MDIEVLGDRYELQEPIGRGGMATIYRALDLRMGRMVAVKILREVYSADPKFVTRFQREARAASALQHPNIVQVFDYGQSGESYYIVMEFVEGSDLRKYLKRNGVLSVDRAIEIGHDVALGLGAAHKRGIVHRDVKPQNIMLNDDGIVKLTDFGIASMYKDAEAERLTTTGMTLGTVQYYAPEQAQGEIVSPAADIYALGIVFYEMLTGRTPFDGDTPVAVAMKHIQELPDPPSRLNPRIPPGLERIILRCLEKDPRDRYRDGDALAYALENYVRGAGTGVRRPTGVAPNGARAPFAPPIGLPVDDRGLGGAAALGGYGAQAMAGRGPATRVASDPAARGLAPGAGPDTLGGLSAEAPTYYDDGFGLDGAVNTRPQGPAAGTAPRSAPGLPGRQSGPQPWTPERPDEEQAGQKRNMPLIIGLSAAGALLVVALFCTLALALGGLLGNGGKTNTPNSTIAPKSVTVPSFVGETFQQAQADGTKNGLNVVQDTSNTATPPANCTPNTVLSQNPAATTAVSPNSTVTVVLCPDAKQIAVPDVTNQVYGDAYTKLQQAGFTNVTEVIENNPNVKTGHVIRTDPPAGQTVTASTPIKVYVSSSPDATPTATPATPTATTSAQPTATATTSAQPTATPTTPTATPPTPTH